MTTPLPAPDPVAGRPAAPGERRRACRSRRRGRPERLRADHAAPQPPPVPARAQPGPQRRRGRGRPAGGLRPGVRAPLRPRERRGARGLAGADRRQRGARAAARRGARGLDRGVPHRVATDEDEAPDGDPASDEPDPERLAASSELRRLLEAAVDALPEEFRTVFVLREVEGLSTAETAASLAIRPETVKTRLHRARRLLQERLSERLLAALAVPVRVPGPPLRPGREPGPGPAAGTARRPRDHAHPGRSPCARRRRWLARLSAFLRERRKR